MQTQEKSPLETSPLAVADIMAFAVTRDPKKCREFYEGKLGLKLIEEDEMALVLQSGKTVIRIQIMKNHEPKKYTILGWKTDDLRKLVANMKTRGVEFQRYEWMEFQDKECVATFPNGDQVAWCQDPDGNVLSIAQLRRD